MEMSYDTFSPTFAWGRWRRCRVNREVKISRYYIVRLVRQFRFSGIIWNMGILFMDHSHLNSITTIIHIGTCEIDAENNSLSRNGRFPPVALDGELYCTAAYSAEDTIPAR